MILTICKSSANHLQTADSAFYSLRSTFWEVLRRVSPWPSGRIYTNPLFENNYFPLVINVVSATREVDVIPVAGRNVSGPEIGWFGSKIINFRYEFTTFPECDFALVKCQVFQWEYLLFQDAKTDKNTLHRTK